MIIDSEGGHTPDVKKPLDGALSHSVGSIVDGSFCQWSKSAACISGIMHSTSDKTFKSLSTMAPGMR